MVSFQCLVQLFFSSLYCRSIYEYKPIKCRCLSKNKRLLFCSILRVSNLYAFYSILQLISLASFNVRIHHRRGKFSHNNSLNKSNLAALVLYLRVFSWLCVSVGLSLSLSLFVRGRTTLLPKSNKTTDATQYRPITCLTTYWKCLSGVLSDKITKHLNEFSILAEEQQGAIKNSYGTKAQLIINKTLVEDAIRKKKDVSMVYVDYAKAFDSVPHQWTLDIMTAYKISPIIINFLAAAMKLWRTDLSLHYEGGCLLVQDIQFKRGIYQGDSLSPLLFIISINPISLLLNRKCKGYHLGDIHISHTLFMDDLKGYCNNPRSVKKMCDLIERFTTDIGMELGLSKCGVVHIKGGKYAKLGGITLESGGLIKELEQHECYKYLGIEELVGLCHDAVRCVKK